MRILDHYFLPRPSNTALGPLEVLVLGNNLKNWKSDYFNIDESNDGMGAYSDGVFDIKIDRELECRIATRITINDDGEEIITRHVAWFPDEVAVQAENAVRFSENFIDEYVFTHTRSEVNIFLNRTLRNLKSYQKEALNDEAVAKYPIIVQSLDSIEDQLNVLLGKKDITKNETYRNDQKLSFTYTGVVKDKNERLKALFQSLTSGHPFKFLAKDTKLANFKRTFSGNEIHNKLKWVGPEGDLRFFILALVESMAVKTNGLSHWEIASNCFVFYKERFDKIKEVIPNKLSVADHDFKNPKNKARWDLLEYLVKELTATKSYKK